MQSVSNELPILPDSLGIFSLAGNFSTGELRVWMIDVIKILRSIFCDLVKYVNCTYPGTITEQRHHLTSELTSLLFRYCGQPSYVWRVSFAKSFLVLSYYSCYSSRHRIWLSEVTNLNLLRILSHKSRHGSLRLVFRCGYEVYDEGMSPGPYPLQTAITNWT
jgi:hypothetical protein